MKSVEEIRDDLTRLAQQPQILAYTKAVADYLDEALSELQAERVEGDEERARHKLTADDLYRARRERDLARGAAQCAEAAEREALRERDEVRAAYEQTSTALTRALKEADGLRDELGNACRGLAAACREKDRMELALAEVKQRHDHCSGLEVELYDARQACDAAQVERHGASMAAAAAGAMLGEILHEIATHLDGGGQPSWLKEVHRTWEQRLSSPNASSSAPS